MLIALFIMSAGILVYGVLRRPATFWQRAIVLLAAILMLATLVALTLEYLARSSGTGGTAIVRHEASL